LQKVGIPLLLMERETPPVSCDLLLSNEYQRGLIIADYMSAKGHRNVLFVHNNKSSAEHFENNSTYCGMCDGLAKQSGLTLNEVKENIVRISELGKKLDGDRCFTAIYSGNYLVPYILKELRLRNLEIPHDISYLVYNSSNSFFFNGLKPDTASEESPMQHAVIEWLEHRVAQADKTGTFTRSIDLEIVPGDTVKEM
jgi:DNA-binding LacI/PurR family transcriptional regulator